MELNADRGMLILELQAGDPFLKIGAGEYQVEIEYYSQTKARVKMRRTYAAGEDIHELFPQKVGVCDKDNITHLLIEVE